MLHNTYIHVKSLQSVVVIDCPNSSLQSSSFQAFSEMLSCCQPTGWTKNFPKFSRSWEVWGFRSGAVGDFWLLRLTLHCWWCGFRRFEETCRLHFQGFKTHFFIDHETLQMKATGFFETSITHRSSGLSQTTGSLIYSLLRNGRL